ncbi:transmembrane glycosyltransferase [Pedobacter sp. Hv1]|nr:transmembrane glycosyltransferase [Pedobacter sp. Hv1]
MELNIIETSLLGALIFCFLVQLYFSLFVHLKLASTKVQSIPENALNPISVIVYARNEAKSLEKYLPNLFNQNYPNFEVVVVNDRSWDGTDDLLERLAKQYTQLKVVTVAEGDKFIAGKKFAVTMGIKASSYDWLVLTDADCEPASANWLMGMQQPAAESTEIVIGYAPLMKKRGFLNVMIRFETFFKAVNYLAYALKGKPYMGVGRNLAYKKSLFFKNKGFAAHMHIAVGDDDLFVNSNGNRNNTEVQINKEAQVWGEPKTSLIAYLREKKVQKGAKVLYKSGHKLMLAIQAIAYFLFYAFTIALLCFKATLYLAIGVFVLSLIVRCLIYPRLLKRLNYGELRWWFPLLDIILFVFVVFNSFLSIFVKKVQWK